MTRNILAAALLAALSSTAAAVECPSIDSRCDGITTRPATVVAPGTATNDTFRPAAASAYAADCRLPTVDEMYKCGVDRGYIKDPYSAWQKEAIGQKQAADRTFYLDQQDPDAGIFVAMLKAMKPEDRACIELPDQAKTFPCLQSHGWKLVHGGIPQ
jgi:hypothetical protein